MHSQSAANKENRKRYNSKYPRVNPKKGKVGKGGKKRVHKKRIIK